SPPKSWPRVSGCAVARPSSTSPTVAPSALTSRSPPTEGRSTGGMRIFAIAEGTLARRGAERLVVGEDAELVVGDLRRLARADRAFRVASHLQLGRRRAERVVDQQAADQRVTLADDELDDLGGLQQAHRAGQHAEDAVGAAGRRELG